MSLKISEIPITDDPIELEEWKISLYRLFTEPKSIAAALIDTTSFDIIGTISNTFTLDSDNTDGNVDLIFGATVNKHLRHTGTQFQFNDDILVAADIAIDTGSITSVSGTISFGNEDLSTTGTLSIDEIILNTGSLTIVNTTSSSTGIIKKGSDNWIHDFHHPTGGGASPVGYNVFIGIDAGNFTMGSSATQTYHASYNVAIGYQALLTNTIGWDNFALGKWTLKANTTGDNNVAIGVTSLSNNTIGSENIAIGLKALLKNTTGNLNIGIGKNAGRKYLGGGINFNETGTNSIFIGEDSWANADGETNQIVIGDTAQGIGSNTVVLGNDNIVTTRLKGTVLTKNVQPHTDDTYYLGKNDDDSPLAYKGVILKDTNDGKYYRIEVTNGSVTVIDLTD